MPRHDLLAQLEGYGLITAEILYHLPDYPALLQSYVWQDYDMTPGYPKLLRFLDFWQGNLDGKVNRVRVGTQRLTSAAEFQYRDGRLVVH